MHFCIGNSHLRLANGNFCRLRVANRFLHLAPDSLQITSYNRYNSSKGRMCGWLSVILGIVCAIIIIGVIVGMPLVVKKVTNNASNPETATLTPWEKFEQDAKYLHEGTNPKGELSTNVFYCLLNEYVDRMDATNCYVYTKIPFSVQEGVTYQSLRLTYRISCSLLLTRFYDQEHVQYFYSNLDVVFSFVPVIEFLNKLAKEHSIKLVRGFFQPTLTFGTAYAHRNNLTCLLTPVEKSFLDHTDDRRKALKERLEKGLEKRTLANDYAYTAIKTQGKLAIDALHIGRLSIYRPKSELDTLFVGTSECRHVFLFQSKWTFMLNGQDPAIPGIYYICGLNAYYRLPKGWYGTCYLGIVFPKIYQIDDLKQIPKMSELQHTRQKRETAAAVVGDIFGAIIPSVGVILNSIKIRKLSTIVDNMLTNFTGAILLMDIELAAERAMTLQNRLALDILLAKSGGVCKMINERHCCAFIPDNSKKIRGMLTNLTRDSADLKEPGVWEKVGKGITQVGNWFSSIWNGVLAKILVGSLIVLICLLGLWLSCKINKRIKTDLAKSNKRKEEKEKEEMFKEIWEKSHRKEEIEMQNLKKMRGCKGKGFV
ncbi:hypothetical protein NDU88_004160 [Pleurodeles waltl]|uniref:Uncharacterized protein n=1 Tax=Pleurodeles waltl TaxID=8319 RepID=A0AAV7NSY2_PLEWA|nr:hypothetical protein NDU88_004160 [Pleurodeles waltl]